MRRTRHHETLFGFLSAIAVLAPISGCGSESLLTSTTTTGSTTGSGGSGGGGTWAAPACKSVSGTPAVTFTRDEGKTLAPVGEKLTPIGYTFGLVALSTPNTLLAEHKGRVYRSKDAGCTWSVLGTVDSSPLILVAAGELAYGFTDNGGGVYRIEGDTITKVKAPADYVVGLGADPKDARHLRAGNASSGMLFESKDGGDSWVKLGTPAPVAEPALVYRVAFDPKDQDHILVGSATSGAAVSFDGGATWKSASGLGAHHTNVFTVAFGPSKVVWAQGIDLDHTEDPVFEGRSIWRSTDGGATFATVAKQSATVTIRNQELLAPHPKDGNVLYFVFGTYFQGYGTDIYRYDHASGKISTAHNHYDDVLAIAFNPAEPSVMYLGLTAETPPSP